MTGRKAERIFCPSAKLAGPPRESTAGLCNRVGPEDPNLEFETEVLQGLLAIWRDVERPTVAFDRLRSMTGAPDIQKSFVCRVAAKSYFSESAFYATLHCECWLEDQDADVAICRRQRPVLEGFTGLLRHEGN
jgi:hypothetical protein